MKVSEILFWNHIPVGHIRCFLDQRTKILYDIVYWIVKISSGVYNNSGLFVHIIVAFGVVVRSLTRNPTPISTEEC